MRYEVFVRTMSLIAVLGLVLVTSGCTYVICFSIRNQSDSELTIAYSVRNSHFGLEPELLGKSGSGDSVYLKFPTERSKIDASERTVELILMPGEEVRIIRMYDRPVDEYRSEFNLTDIQLSSRYGNGWFSGRDQVFDLFKPVNSGAFAFGPKIIGFELEYH